MQTPARKKALVYQCSICDLMDLTVISKVVAYSSVVQSSVTPVEVPSESVGNWPQSKCRPCINYNNHASSRYRGPRWLPHYGAQAQAR